MFGEVFYYDGRVKKETPKKKISFVFPHLKDFEKCGLLGKEGVIRKFNGQSVKIVIYKFQSEMDSFSAFTTFIDSSSRFFEIYHGGFVRGEKIYVWIGKFLTISEFKDILKINSIRYLEWMLKQYPHKKNLPEIFEMVINLPYPILFCRYYSNEKFLKDYDENEKFKDFIPFLHVLFRVKEGNVDFFITKNKINPVIFKKYGFLFYRKGGFFFWSNIKDRKVFMKISSLIIENKNKMKKFFRRDNFTYTDLILNGFALAFLLLFMSIIAGVIFGIIKGYLKRNKNEEEIVVLRLKKEEKSENNKKGSHN